MKRGIAAKAPEPGVLFAPPPCTRCRSATGSRFGPEVKVVGSASVGARRSAQACLGPVKVRWSSASADHNPPAAAFAAYVRTLRGYRANHDRALGSSRLHQTRVAGRLGRSVGRVGRDALRAGQTGASRRPPRTRPRAGRTTVKATRWLAVPYRDAFCNPRARLSVAKSNLGVMPRTRGRARAGSPPPRQEGQEWRTFQSCKLVVARLRVPSTSRLSFSKPPTAWRVRA